MKSEYYRVRVSFNTQVERDQMCIAYLQRDTARQYETIKQLVYEAILAREAERHEEDQIQQLKKEIDEKDHIIDTLREKQKGGNYYEIVVDSEAAGESSGGKLFRKKKRQKEDNVPIRKYHAEERQLDPELSLEELVLSEKVDPGSMTMLSVAIEQGIDEKLIRSMIMENLSAKEIRGVINIVQAKKARERKGDDL